jgi:transcriptional regulator with XRE-family HTH domain
MSGKQIRSWMKKQGLSQRELARVIGVHETTVSRIITGSRRIGVRPAMLLAKEMGIPMETFFQ